MKLSTVKPLDMSGLDTEAGVRSMIDLALSVRDEQWFNELTSTLLTLQSRDMKTTQDPAISGYYQNRLGVDQL
ncbi:IDEAL domain protein [compost metagenome]